MADSIDTPDFLDEVGVSGNLRRIVARTAAEFEATGDWVSFDVLAYESATGEGPYELSEIFRLPAAIGGAWSTEKVNLTGLGLMVAGTASDSCNLMTAMVKICVARKLRDRDEARIGRTILETEYNFDIEEIQRSLALIQLVRGISAGGRLGDDWELMIFRTAITDYLHVQSVDQLRDVLVSQAWERMRMHEQALAVAPAFAQEGIFQNVFAETEVRDPRPQIEPDDASAVFIVHGRDQEAKESLWEFLEGLGLHPLDWEEDLVAATGQGSPFIGQILEAAFARAQAVVVLMTPDDSVRLHPDLVLPGERAFEEEVHCQPRPNVLFEAGMAFGYNPTRTILVEVGTLRPVSDLGGRHTVRLGTEETLKALARRLESAGCQVDRSGGDWLNVERFTRLQARSRTADAKRPSTD